MDRWQIRSAAPGERPRDARLKVKTAIESVLGSDDLAKEMSGFLVRRFLAALPPVSPITTQKELELQPQRQTTYGDTIPKETLTGSISREHVDQEKTVNLESRTDKVESILRGTDDARR